MDVKILSRALAGRVQSVIGSIITKDQNAFIKGRNIGENILDVYSMIAAAEDNEGADILVFLDIENHMILCHGDFYQQCWINWVSPIHLCAGWKFFIGIRKLGFLTMDIVQNLFILIKVWLRGVLFHPCCLLLPCQGWLKSLIEM